MVTFFHSFQNQILPDFPLIQSGYKALRSRIRLKQDQHFSTCRKVQNGNSRVHQGIVDRPIRCLPSHPHPPKLKEIPKVLPQVAGVPVHLSSFRPGHSPSGLYNDCKGSEAYGPHEGTQTSPIPGQLADQVPVSGRSPS